MNVSEYIVKFLEDKGINRVFGVVGGAALWFCKALSESSTIKTVFTNHEQAATMAADGWARVSGKPGIVFTINGPGMTNTVTGIAQAWVDSSPVILITGNSNLKSVQFERKLNMRQYGTQDIRTDLLMKPITKKTFLLEDAADVKECMEQAYFTAVCGRPGPVCIEVPINIQSAEVPVQLRENKPLMCDIPEIDIDIAEEVVQKLIHANRPLILAGQGVRLGNAVDEFRQFIEEYQIPVVNSRMGIDSIESNSPLFVGRCGNHGNRPSHFAIETCDVLLVLGSRLAPNTTGYAVEKFSKQSYKILIDIDKKELTKHGLTIDKIIHADLKEFILYALRHKKEIPNLNQRQKWVLRCQEWRKKYPIMQLQYMENEKISTYRVIEAVSQQASQDALILSDTGSCCSIVAQIWHIKKEQRMFISGGLSAMGYWVTSMGLGLATDGQKQIICFVGDGSLQMNIHELATIKQYGLPIKIFVISNNGYQFVKMSQSGYGITPPFGTDIVGGVPIPNIEKVTRAYGIDYIACTDNKMLDKVIDFAMKANDAILCELFVDDDQEVCPRLKSIALEDGSFVSPEYANLYPFLDDKILAEELAMIECKD